MEKNKESITLKKNIGELKTRIHNAERRFSALKKDKSDMIQKVNALTNETKVIKLKSSTLSDRNVAIMQGFTQELKELKTKSNTIAQELKQEIKELRQDCNALASCLNSKNSFTFSQKIKDKTLMEIFDIINKNLFTYNQIIDYAIKEGKIYWFYLLTTDICSYSVVEYCKSLQKKM